MYHFNKYIGLRPTSPQAERAKERILACRQELAQSAALTMTPGIQVMQRQLEFLTITNREMQRKLDEWQKWYANQGRFGAQTALLPVSPPATGRTAAPTNSRPVTADPTADPGRATSVGAPPRPPMPETKTHLVQPRDTMAAIARKHGVSVNALMSANPRVDARHMKTGQALYIPPR
jgi:hypothetical protein